MIIPKKVESLLRQVEEVVYNNDWPTIAGKQDEEGNCEILELVKYTRECFNEYE